MYARSNSLSCKDLLETYQQTVKTFDRPMGDYHFRPLRIKQSKLSSHQLKKDIIVDEATFWADYYEDPDIRYEWNDGKLEEKPMAVISSILCTDWFISLIKEYLSANNYKHIILADVGFKLNLPNKTVIRRPDHAILLGRKALRCDIHAASYDGIYDICIETLSRSKQEYIDRDTKVKKNEYSQGKVKEYYIIDDKKQQTKFYRLNKKGGYRIIKPHNGIIRSTVLPGFQFREIDIYEQPDILSLISDPVYKSFVAKRLQQEIKAKESAIRRAEQERQAKDDALKTAEQERKAKEQERQAKDDALKTAEQERVAKEKLEQLLKDKGIEF
jgi:Uma2 family endonuclease